MTGQRTTVSCFDRIFDKFYTEKYCLSIRLQSDGLFYSVYDPDQEKFIGFESVLLEDTTRILQYIEKHQILKNKFAKTLCIIPSAKYTIIPEELYLPDKALEYFQFVHTINENEELRIADVITDKAKLIYTVPTAFSDLVNEYFTSAALLPQIGAIANYIQPRFRNMQPSIVINLNVDNFDLIVVDAGKLKFCNNFKYLSLEDLTYYTIFVIDQLKLSADTLELRLAGNMTYRIEILKLLRKYIRKVDVINVDNAVRLSYALSEIDIAAYLDLFNPRLCE